jgi:hypothetical protein
MVVNPGESITLQPEDCASASGYRVFSTDPWDPCPTGCDAGCDLGSGRAYALFQLVNTVGHKYLTSTIYGQFTISDSSNTNSELDATIAYDISWLGIWTLGGIFTNYNDVRADVIIYLYDVSAGNRVVMKTDPPVHSVVPSGFINLGPDGGAAQDSGSTSNSMVAKLIRGHTYRVALSFQASGKGIDNANISLDYESLNGGLYWDHFTVSVSPDLAEQLARLEERVSKLEDEVTHLQSDLQHHTHTYLTGRGEGHNNTEAQTSEAIIMEEENLVDSTLAWLPTDVTEGEPLPSKSVLLTNYPNPFNPTTTILFSLPEPSQTQIVVYNTLGQKVMTLLDEFCTAGEHTVRLDASGLATGVYFYRLTTSRYAETRKLLLLR